MVNSLQILFGHFVGLAPNWLRIVAYIYQPIGRQNYVTFHVYFFISNEAFKLFHLQNYFHSPSHDLQERNIWEKVFKNGPSNIF